MAQQPNVVFVLTDDQGYPPLGCHGHPFIQTPNLDEFYENAVRFDDFHTGTTCAPTRAGLLTGHYCNSTGVWHTIGGRSLLRNNEWTLATALRENGYRTAIFGKWHLGDDYPYRPQDRGFETTVCHGGGGVSQQPDWWGNDYFDDTYYVNGTPQTFTGYCTDVFFDEALRFIENHRDEPFFCYISTNAPHSPFNVEPAYRDIYTEDTDSEKYRRFLGMLTNIDDNFGRLRVKLAELNLEEDTILIFMSDNGQTGVNKQAEVFNAGMRGMKGSPYEGGHRVPFFLRWPGGGISEGRTVETLTSYVDFMPTILELCSVQVPEHRHFHGDSLVPLLRGENDGSWQERVVVTDTQRVPHPLKWRKSCVMKDSWRLVNRDELYNLADDPGQESNVADQHPELVHKLREEYEKWWDICSKQLDEPVPIAIGSDDQQCTVLRTQDLRVEGVADGGGVWNQKQVRQGEKCYGWWEIEVEQNGTYEFELRRWPEEAGHNITHGIEGDDIVFRRDGIAPDAEAWYTGGQAIPFDTAQICISEGTRRSADITDNDEAVRFHVQLPKGVHYLRAYFSCAEGTYTTAYYVYVRKTDKR